MNLSLTIRDIGPAAAGWPTRKARHVGEFMDEFAHHPIDEERRKAATDPNLFKSHRAQLPPASQHRIPARYAEVHQDVRRRGTIANRHPHGKLRTPLPRRRGLCGIQLLPQPSFASESHRRVEMQ